MNINNKSIQSLLEQLARSDEPMLDGLEEWAEPIADYLSKHGVVVHPVQIGQTVYVIDKADLNTPIKEQTVVEIRYGYNKHVFVLQHRPTMLRIEHVFYDFGRTVFATYNEANMALKKARGN